MTRPLFIVAASFLVLAWQGSSVDHPAGSESARAGEPAPDKAKADEIRQEEFKARDLKKLQGQWKVIGEQYLGQVQVQNGDRGTYSFKDDTLTYTFKDIRKSGTFTIDVSKRPKCLYWTILNKENKKETIAYIYTFDDDHLLLTCSVHEWTYHDRPPRDFGSGTTEFRRLEPTKD